MDEIEDKALKIYSGKRDWYELVLAAVFFSIAIYILLMFLYQLLFEAAPLQFIVSLSKFFIYGLPSIASGITFSMTKDIEIENNTIQTYYIIGPFSKKVISKVDEFEYVSVFLDGKGFYQANLWYKKNKHYQMYSFEEKEPAMRFAQMVSEKLNIDLFDATEKGNSKWIEIEHE